ncbi:hypothetical protein T484DRAFT_1855795 [Baffinella frigidus]|nr:hypothetical protein T484DRAFT_1855795 [Cryptophyta sp. CCMP2293]
MLLMNNMDGEAMLLMNNERFTDDEAMLLLNNERFTDDEAMLLLNNERFTDDEAMLLLNNERFTVPEALFSPTILGMEQTSVFAGVVLLLNNERFTVPAALFSPTILGMKQRGVADAIQSALALLDPGLHPLLYSTVVPIGGNAMIPGFQAYLAKKKGSFDNGGAYRGQRDAGFQAYLAKEKDTIDDGEY